MPESNNAQRNLDDYLNRIWSGEIDIDTMDHEHFKELVMNWRLSTGITGESTTLRLMEQPMSSKLPERNINND